MTEPEDTPAGALADAGSDDAQAPAGRRPGDRLAKVIARAGLGSRREAEAWIEQGRVAVNGATVSGPNLNVEPGDRVEVDGRPLPERERTRLWLYHKPRGYVTTTHDPEGRETVFSILPESMPRVMTVGRLDINTEGLLLLTNDGGLARVLELPETGWLRRYRVRAFGRTDPGALEKLKDGVEIDGFAYGAIDAEIERQQKDNVWLRFGLREGKNREVKRVAEHLGLSVNRLIRISFGPFQLGDLPEGGIEEVRTRTLVEQLGKRLAEEAGCDFEAPVFGQGEDAPRKTGGRGSAGRPPAAPERRRVMDPAQRIGARAPIARPRDMARPASAGESEAPETKTKRAAPIADRRGRQVKVERVTRTDPDAAPKRVRRKDEGAAERFGAAGRPPRPERPARGDADRERRPGRGRDGDARSDRGAGRPERAEGGRPRRASQGERFERGGSDRPRRFEGGERPERAPSDRPRVSTPRWRDETGEAPRERPARPRPEGGRPGAGEARPFRRQDGDRPRGDAPRDGRPRDGAQREGRSWGGKPRNDTPSGDKSWGDKSWGDRPWGDRPRGEKPGGDRPRGEKSFGGKPKSFGAKSSGDRTRGEGRAAPGERPQGRAPGGKPGGGKPFGEPGSPRGPRPGGGAPRGGGKGRGKGGGKGPGSGAGKGRPGGADRRR